MPLRRNVTIALVIVIIAIAIGALVWWYAQPTAPAQPVKLKVASGRPGSTGWIQDATLAKICEKYNVGLEVTVIASTGSVENLKMLREGKADIGMVTLGFAIQCYYGQGPFANDPNPNIRLLTPRQINYLHIVTLEDTGIKTVYDLAGKRVSVSTPGSYNNLKAMALLKALGLADKVIADPIEWDQGLAALRDRRIDAVIFMTAPPQPQVTELFSLPGLKPKLISLSDDDIAKFISTYPEHVVTDMPPTMYGQGYPVHTVAELSCYVCTTSLPAEVAYKFLKTIYEHYKEMAQESTNWAVWQPKWGPMARGKGVPYHDGAVKFYKDIGLWKD
jgi:TRAP transporter TAXI family solute receptor